MRPEERLRKQLFITGEGLQMNSGWQLVRCIFCTASMHLGLLLNDRETEGHGLEKKPTYQAVQRRANSNPNRQKQTQANDRERAVRSKLNSCQAFATHEINQRSKSNKKALCQFFAALVVPALNLLRRCNSGPVRSTAVSVCLQRFRRCLTGVPGRRLKRYLPKDLTLY